MAPMTKVKNQDEFSPRLKITRHLSHIVIGLCKSAVSWAISIKRKNLSLKVGILGYRNPLFLMINFEFHNSAFS